MKLLVCASFLLFFGLFAGFGTISGFSIDGYFEGLNELDDYYYDYSGEPTNDEITLHIWNLEVPEEVDYPDSERTKVQSVVQRDDCFLEALKDVLNFFKITQLFAYLNYNKAEIQPAPNNTSSEDTTSKNSSSLVTPAPHETPKKIPSTVAPEIAATTAESKDTTTRNSSLMVTSAPDGAGKNVSSTEIPETVKTTAESLNNVTTVDKNGTNARK